MLHEIGVVHGRFQPFHNDHLVFVLAAKRYCKHIIIGITSPDPFLSPSQEKDRNRGIAFSNPCTYYERTILIASAMKENGINCDEFTIVPFPIEFPERLKFYAPTDAMYFITIYDEWGEEKLRRLKQEGLQTTVLWKRADKGICATDVRRLIHKGGDWEHLVPNSVAEKIKSLGIDSRIKKLDMEV